MIKKINYSKRKGVNIAASVSLFYTENYITQSKSQIEKE